MDTKSLTEKFKERVAGMGGELYEMFSSSGSRLTRYLVILPGGHVGFAEFGDSERSESSIKAIHSLRKLGCAAFAIKSDEQINSALSYILSDAGKDPCWLAYQRYCNKMEEDADEVQST